MRASEKVVNYTTWVFFSNDCNDISQLRNHVARERNIDNKNAVGKPSGSSANRKTATLLVSILINIRWLFFTGVLYFSRYLHEWFFFFCRYLKEFRTQQCPLFLQHKCTQHRPFTCFHWHFMNQRRRRPIRKRDGTFNYSPDVYCTKYDDTNGLCPDGDEWVSYCLSGRHSNFGGKYSCLPEESSNFRLISQKGVMTVVYTVRV